MDSMVPERNLLPVRYLRDHLDVVEWQERSILPRRGFPCSAGRCGLITRSILQLDHQPLSLSLIGRMLSLSSAPGGGVGYKLYIQPLRGADMGVIQGLYQKLSHTSRTGTVLHDIQLVMLISRQSALVLDFAILATEGVTAYEPIPTVRDNVKVVAVSDQAC